MSKLNYRPEIDGLRAIAVLVVICFHAKFQAFTGGFVGVDIFFVISGYLITSIIYQDIQENRFSIVNFYERRARRILPAFFLIASLTIPFSLIWLIPSELADYAQSLIAANLFSSNILFWIESGYFSSAADLKPLLHTWSLSIEEQYYVFFPLILLILKKYPKTTITVISAITLASFSASVYLSTRDTSANFYLIHTRAWELGVGSLTALITRDRYTPANLYANFLTMTGLLLIGYSVVSFDENSPFPGILALAPTIGTALILSGASAGSLAGRILSLRPIVGVGLISYSLYLWHHPIFAFMRVRKMSEPTPLEYLMAITVSIILALISYKLIEKPFRKRSFLDRKAIFLYSFSLLLAFVSIGFLILNNVKEIKKERVPTHCLWPKTGTYSGCTYSNNSGDKRHVVLWGDSFSEAISESLKKTILAKDFAFTSLVAHACPSLLDSIRVPLKKEGSNLQSGCYNHNQDVASWLATTRPDVVVLANNYLWYSSAENEKGYPILKSEDRTKSGFDAVANGLEETIGFLNSQDIAVVVVNPHGTLPDFNSKIREYTISNLRGAFEMDFKRADSFVKRISEYLSKTDHEYHFVSPRAIFCGSNDACSAMKEDKLLLFDSSHLSSIGAWHLAQIINESIEQYFSENTNDKTPESNG